MPASERCQKLRDALELWRGAPLEEFGYEAFAQSEIARLGELRLTLLEERIDAVLGHPTHDPHGDPIPTRDGTIAPMRGKPLATARANSCHCPPTPT